MGGIAQLAKSLGIEVSGCDAGVYPPMSDQLKQAGIHLIEGYDPEQLDAGADLYIIGNAISRGNPLLEEILALHVRPAVAAREHFERAPRAGSCRYPR